MLPPIPQLLADLVRLPSVNPMGRTDLPPDVLYEGRVTDFLEAQFRDLGPDEVELKFGVKLDAQAGAVIARTGLQGQFEVKLKWVREGVSPSEEAAAEPEE